MKRLFISLKQSIISKMLIYLILLSSGFIACNKGDHFYPPGSNDAARFSSDVIDKWMTMQIRLERDATGVANASFCRYFAYSGIAALEAIAPGTDLSHITKGRWNGLTGLPQADQFKPYYWRASVNTALAFMNRSIFINANATDKAAIDSLEAALNTSYLSLANTQMVARSDSFGKAVATAVYNWSETDGYKNQSTAYTPPVGPGLWVPTPPAFAPASTPYLGNNRTIIAGSIDNTVPGAPIAYSEDPKSDFYQMALNDYNVSLTLTPEQTNQGLFWRDIPGVTTAGHWLSILQQVIKQTGSHLDKAAFAYAISGTCLSDATISCWQAKYKYNLVRPITYIRSVIGYTAWNSLITTPAHPEYPAAHAFISSATADALTSIFGNIGSFTDHTYDYLGLTAITFNSFHDIAVNAANSRVFGGIHYQPSCDTGIITGSKVTTNILRKLGMPAGDGHYNQ